MFSARDLTITEKKVGSRSILMSSAQQTTDFATKPFHAYMALVGAHRDVKNADESGQDVLRCQQGSSSRHLPSLRRG